MGFSQFENSITSLKGFSLFLHTIFFSFRKSFMKYVQYIPYSFLISSMMVAKSIIFSNIWTYLIDFLKIIFYLYIYILFIIRISLCYEILEISMILLLFSNFISFKKKIIENILCISKIFMICIHVVIIFFFSKIYVW